MINANLKNGDKRKKEEEEEEVEQNAHINTSE